MNNYRKAKAGKVFAIHQGFSTDFDLQEALEKDIERREIERKLQEEENKRLMYVDHADRRFSL